MHRQAYTRRSSIPDTLRIANQVANALVQFGGRGLGASGNFFFCQLAVPRYNLNLNLHLTNQKTEKLLGTNQNSGEKVGGKNRLVVLAMALCFGFFCLVAADFFV